jgi:hypothetical protein
MIRRENMAEKTRWITVRAEQSDVDRLESLAQAAEVDKSVTLRAIVRTATPDQVKRGIKLAQRRGM